MKPHRIKMAHNLILNAGLNKKMDMLVRPITFINPKPLLNETTKQYPQRRQNEQHVNR